VFAAAMVASLDPARAPALPITREETVIVEPSGGVDDGQGTGRRGPGSRLRTRLALSLTGFGLTAVLAGGAVAAVALTRNEPDTPPASPTATSPAGTPEESIPAASGTVYAFIVDSSRSMADNIGDTVKLDFARQTVLLTAQALPADAQVSLWSFGSESFAGTTQSCSDTQKLLGPDSNQEIGIAAALSTLTPNGASPITTALLNAGEDAIARANAAAVVLVLITDDRDKCGSVPLAAVQQLGARGLEVTLHVLGLNLDRASREDLSAAVDASAPGSTFTEIAGAGGVPRALPVR
jgi:hypothetical protein